MVYYHVKHRQSPCGLWIDYSNIGMTALECNHFRLGPATSRPECRDMLRTGGRRGPCQFSYSLPPLACLSHVYMRCYKVRCLGYSSTNVRCISPPSARRTWLGRVKVGIYPLWGVLSTNVAAEEGRTDVAESDAGPSRDKIVFLSRPEADVMNKYLREYGWTHRRLALQIFCCGKHLDRHKTESRKQRKGYIIFRTTQQQQPPPTPPPPRGRGGL